MNSHSLEFLLKSVKLPSFASSHQQVAHQAEREGWSFTTYLRHLTETELEDRRMRKIERLLKASRLPKDKTIATLDMSRFPRKVQRQLPVLAEGHFLKRAENILAFGLPGRGKTHLACAIGHELVQKGHSVLFTPAFRLVQGLLTAVYGISGNMRIRRNSGLFIVESLAPNLFVVQIRMN